MKHNLVWMLLALPLYHMNPSGGFSSNKRYRESLSLTTKFRPTLNRIPEYDHFEEQWWTGWHSSRQNHGLQWPGNDRRSSRQSVYLEGNGPLSGPFVPPDQFLFSAEVILASSTSKFGIEIPCIDDEDLNSSTEATISTSLHCRNCEKVHTSVLNVIFQQANVAGVGNLSK